MDTQSELSLPEYLYLLSIAKEDKAFDPYYILSLLLELAYDDIITLKPKTTWLLKEKQVIVLNNPSYVSPNSVLELMLDRLKNQKHDHSVQQWADHWIGNTWKELLFPQHPIQTLKSTIASRLEQLGFVKKENQTYQITENGTKQVESFKQSATENISKGQGKSLLLLVLHPAFLGFVSSNSTLPASSVLESSSFNNQTKEVLKEIQIYASTLKS